MAQNWKTMSYASSNVAVTDLTNFETNFAVLRSNFLGTSAPSATDAGLLWFDSTNKLMKMRDSADTGWQGLMYGSVNTKIWAYLDSAPDGWVVDSGVTDKIIALEGGSTYTTAGSTQGSWTMSGLSSSSDSHNHQWYYFDGQWGWSYNSAGTLIRYYDYVPAQWEVNTYGWVVQAYYTGRVRDVYNPNLHTEDVAHNHTGATYTSAWRPAAAVGVLLYPNI